VTRYVLPDLRYDYGALEPHISGETMELHHDRHHRAYVDAANRAVERLLEVRRRGDFEQVATLEHQLAFNVSGHVLHSIFWQNLSPRGGGRPTGALGDAIVRDFGTFHRFQQQMVETAVTVQGSGWAALVFDPLVKRLGTTQIHDHQAEITQGGIPLLVIDAWEHAYYLQYRADKAKFFDAVWNLWDWEDVAARFDRAQQLDLNLLDVAEGTPVRH
jgi:Fe-Mn family superoxide dismutase